MKEKKALESSLPGRSRRGFLKMAATGSVAGISPLLTLSEAHASTHWEKEFDVIVVGSGAAGLVAAVSAAAEGASVLIIEKAPVIGGTTAKSDGGYWIPNNRFMKDKGVDDPREDALAYMAKCARPQLFNPSKLHLGLPEGEFRLLESFYDNGSKAIDFLERISALKSGLFFMLPDYVEHFQENKAPKGRVLSSAQADGGPGRGMEIIRQLKAWVDNHKIPLLLRHQAKELLLNNQGEVVGLKVTDKDGREFSVRARRGVVFGSGGYAQNADFVRRFQPGPIYGACAVPSAQGDFVRIAQGAGAELGNMVNAWRMQILLEQALEYPSVPRGVWQPPGDSMIMVNKHGVRVVNEKRNYHERSQAHFVWDATRSEYPNQFLFMVYDRRSAELFAGNFPLPFHGAAAPYVIKAPTLDSLGQAIQDRLDRLVLHTGPFRLSEGFSKNLAETVERFNENAASGMDQQFQRGAFAYDREWHTAYTSVARPDTSWNLGETPNVTMHPFQANGPYYAIILAPGMLDTNGGPLIDASSRVLDMAGQPIKGLYGAGNCIASPAGQSYWGGGATIGLAITFGFLAGINAARGEGKRMSRGEQERGANL